jgi:hypothetical protein
MMIRAISSPKNETGDQPNALNMCFVKVRLKFNEYRYCLKLLNVSTL